MNNPRIIILMHYLELGGAEMALIGLLHALDPEKVDVDLFIYSHQGPLMEHIPNWVNLLPEVPAYAVIERPMTEALRRGHIGVVAGRTLAKYKCRNYRRKKPATGDDSSIMQYIGDCVTPWLPRINPGVEYDLCISFLTPHNIGLDKVRARKRLAWIHTDYSTVSINVERELPVWGAYDSIVSISKEVSRSFCKTFPTLESKMIEIENILPTEFVRTRAEEFDAKMELNGGINILSIGRFCSAKNYDNVPDIARRMVDMGVRNLKWYIIGFGGDEALIRSKIREAGMEEHVILLGKKENPYPYIKACDIYVQPSRYEGKSVTVREAQMLCKPVVVTAYPTAASQIRNGVDGTIVPLDNAGAAKGLAEFIANTALQTQIKNYLQTHDYANLGEVEKIYSLLK
ncbi:MAG: glycosyltransferase [Bacteroides sp.]|nr:glycosyltransferase [Bacteroides sp.]